MKLFDEENQDTEIKKKIASDLNWILSRVEYIQGQQMDNTDREFCASAQRIVDRVAEFEEIAGQQEQVR